MRIGFTLDGRDVAVDVEPRRTLADVLRDDLGQTGVHLGCEHGVCGTCTVLVDGEPVRACLQLTAQVARRHVRTVAGLEGPDGALDPLQEAFSTERGLQCGFCTPGFLMLLRGALDEDPTVVDDPARLDALLASNLCRCTGYEGIRNAARRARDS
ncbi:(2Fe-2S)-binding protein [Actinomycetospora lemnae]|uniref:(2Fe-2S)-binding protein n=1 Tax=Actinomycetospora lemnae TaxID=3019891 RepID=A0ABT5T0P4_9PSEU|nr:(2Fe-2S)-binding protein [Actinomycetospora sp. DW7H6]MDD7968685.1 (2Fe-2S)-binding protein [Actinomycetospora sp. DW7H6]